MATSDAAFASLAASWRQQLDAAAALGLQPPTAADASRATHHDSALPGHSTTSSGVARSDRLQSGGGGASSSSGANETAGTQPSPDTPLLRAPAMVHPADEAAVEAALRAGLFLETAQPPWRGAWPGPHRHAAFTILIRSAAPLASQDQSVEAYRAALQAYEQPANAYSRSTAGAGDAGNNISAETIRAVFLCSVQALLPVLRPLAEAAFPEIGSESVRLQQLMTVTAILPACPYRIATATRICRLKASGRLLMMPSQSDAVTAWQKRCHQETQHSFVLVASGQESWADTLTGLPPGRLLHLTACGSFQRQQLPELAAALRVAAGLGPLQSPPQWRAHVPGTSRRSSSLNLSRRSSAAGSSMTVLAGMTEGRSASDRTPALLSAADAATTAATSSSAEPALRPVVYHISAVAGPALPAPAAPTAAPARALSTAETTSQGSQATPGRTDSNFSGSRLRSAALWPAAMLRRRAGGREGWSTGIGSRLLECTRCCWVSEAPAAAPPPPPHTRAPQAQQPLPDAAAAAHWLEALARQARQSSTSDDGDKLAAETPGCGLLIRKKRRPASRLPPDFPSTALAKSLLENFMCPITHELMRVPVIAADGISYEKEAIRRWFAMGHASSPWTNQPLPMLQLIPNRAAKAAITALTAAADGR